MKTHLSYLYVGQRFPDLNGRVVLLRDLADQTDLEYNLLKNRMQTKRKTFERREDVVIDDKDLIKRKRDGYVRQLQTKKQREDLTWNLNTQWLRKKIV